MICKTARLQVARIARAARRSRVQENKNSRITIVTRISQELHEPHKTCNCCKVINRFPDDGEHDFVATASLTEVDSLARAFCSL